MNDEALPAAAFMPSYNCTNCEKAWRERDEWRRRAEKAEASAKGWHAWALGLVTLRAEAEDNLTAAFRLQRELADERDEAREIIERLIGNWNHGHATDESRRVHVAGGSVSPPDEARELDPEVVERLRRTRRTTRPRRQAWAPELREKAEAERDQAIAEADTFTEAAQETMQRMAQHATEVAAGPDEARKLLDEWKARALAAEGAITRASDGKRGLIVQLIARAERDALREQLEEARKIIKRLTMIRRVGAGADSDAS